MIKSISITNFKGIKETITIDLKPITLLFGPNSAGKSTILQSLLLFKEILTSKECDIYRSTTTPGILDLGGFENYIYNKDKSLTTVLQIGFDLPGDGLIEYSHTDIGDIFNLPEYYKQYQSLGSSYNDLGLEIGINWNSELNRPVINSYTIQNDNEVITSIRYNTKESYVFFVNLDNKILQNIYPSDELDKVKEYLQITHQDSGVILHGSFLTSIRQNDGFSVTVNKGIPYWGYSLYPMDFFNEGPDLVQDGLLNILADLTVSVGEILQNKLSTLIHVGPIREIPDRKFTPYSTHMFERWSNGLAAWDALYNNWVSIDKVNDWLNKIGINNKIEKRDVYELTPEAINSIMSQSKGKVFNKISDIFDRYIGSQAILADSFNETISSIYKIFDEYDSNILKNIREYPKKQQINLIDRDKNIELSPHDVGVGISQVLPIIIGSLMGARTFLSVEQPELHIHPAFQVELADLFIDQNNRFPDKIFLIETHSEHIILRLLKRIRESMKDEHGDLRFSPDQLSIYFCLNNISGQSIKKLEVDARGRFISKWPHGFFEERINEVM